MQGIMLAVVVVVVVTMVMVMVMAQQPGADQIHHKADHGNASGLQETDGLRMNKALRRLPGDQRRDNDQGDRAGEACQFAPPCPCQR